MSTEQQPQPDQNSQPDQPEQPEAPQEGGDEQQGFSADYVKKLRDEAAKYRKEAKANAEAKAKLDELEQANQTELEKAQKRISEAESERDAAKASELRYRIAAAHGVSDADTELFLTGTDEDTLTKQAKRLSDREAEKKSNGNHVPREGHTPRPAGDDERLAFANFLAGDQP